MADAINPILNTQRLQSLHQLDYGRFPSYLGDEPMICCMADAINPILNTQRLQSLHQLEYGTFPSYLVDEPNPEWQ
jgi:phage baseplate assembly protein W